MVVAVGAALASTAIGAASGIIAGGGIAAGLTFTFGLTGGAALLSHFLVTTALGAALSALTPKPRGAASSNANRGYERTVRAAAADRAVIYGETEVGGVIVYEGTEGSSNKFLYQVIAFAGHRIEEFVSFTLNDEVVTVGSDNFVDSPSKYGGKVRIETRLGTNGQSAVSNFVDEVSEWTASCTLSGVAYVAIRYEFDADAFPNGVPELKAVIKGKRVFDPRINQTVWSDNPALCLRDYLIEQNYGVAENSDAIDDELFASAADVCDRTADNGEKFYTCNGAFLTSETPYDVLSNLLTSMGGLLWYAQGKWRVKPAYWTSASVDYTLDDLRGPISVNTRHSRRDNYNIIRGTFKGPESDYKVTDFPQVTNQAFLDADNGEENVISIDLPFTDNFEEARRLSRITLERNRQQLTVNTTMSLKAFQNQIGDTVRLTVDRYGWNLKEFEIVAWTLSMGQNLEILVQVTLRETAESIFDEVDDGAVYERDNTTLPDPFNVPDLGLEITPILQVLNQKLVNSASINTTTNRPEAVDLVEVQFKPTGTTEWLNGGTGELGLFIVSDIDRTFFDFRVRAINTFGIKGAYTQAPPTEIAAEKNPPENVQEFEHELVGSTLFFSWRPVDDLDLSHYEIRRSDNITGVSWANSSTVIEKVARPSTTATVVAKSGTYSIKAYDKIGNPSVDATFLTINPGDIPSLGNTTTKDQDPSFSGTRDGVTVVAGELVATDTSGTGTKGIYYLGQWW